MTSDEFEIEAQRLVNFYGKQQVNAAKLEVIWDCVNGMPREWFSRTIAKFCRELKTSPMPIDFIEAKKNYLLPNAPKAKPYRSIFSEEERGDFINTIRAVRSGAAAPEALKSFKDMIKNIIKDQNLVFCNICENAGSVRATKDNYLYWFNCVCSPNKDLGLPTWGKQYERTYTLEG